MRSLEDHRSEREDIERTFSHDTARAKAQYSVDALDYNTRIAAEICADSLQRAIDERNRALARLYAPVELPEELEGITINRALPYFPVVLGGIGDNYVQFYEPYDDYSGPCPFYWGRSAHFSRATLRIRMDDYRRVYRQNRGVTVSYPRIDLPQGRTFPRGTYIPLPQMPPSTIRRKR